MALKVLHISDRIGASPEGGGAEVICANYIRLGQQFRCDIETITADNYSTFYGFQLLERISQSPPDLIHIHNAYSLLTPDLLEAILEDFPTVITVYDVRPICPTSLKLQGDGTSCELPLSVLCLRESCTRSTLWGHPEIRQISLEQIRQLQQGLGRLRQSHIVVLSSYVKRQFLINGFLPEDVSVVTPPLNIPLLESPPTIKREGCPRLLYVGRVERNKGIYFLADVLNALDLPNWHLDVVGDSPERTEIEQYFQHRSFRGTVTFHGFQKPGQLLDFYDQSSLLVVPSLVSETFCQVISEAMARGLPVVALGVGAVQDWVEHENTALIIPKPDIRYFARGIEEVLKDQELAARLSLNGWRYACNTFPESLLRAQLEEAYNAALTRWKERGNSGSMSLSVPSSPDRPAYVNCLPVSRLLIIAPTLIEAAAGCAGLAALYAALGRDARFFAWTEPDPVEMERIAHIPGLGSSFAARRQQKSQPEPADALAVILQRFSPEAVCLPGPCERYQEFMEMVLPILRKWNPHQDVYLFEVDRPIAADRVVDISNFMELKRQAISGFHHHDFLEAVPALNNYRGVIATGLGGTYAEAFRSTDIETLAVKIEAFHQPPDAQINMEISPLRGKRFVFICESPNAPTASGQLIRNIVMPLREKHGMDLTLMVPYNWPGDLSLPFRVLPFQRKKDIADILKQTETDCLFLVDKLSGKLGETAAEAIKTFKHTPSPRLSILFTSIDGVIDSNRFDTFRGFEQLIFPNHYSLRTLEQQSPEPVEESFYTVLPVGVNPGEYFPFDEAERFEAKTAILPEHVVEEGWYVLLNISRNNQREDLPRTLLMFRELLKKVPHCFLHLHTHPFEGDFDLFEIARNLGLTSRNLGFSMQPFNAGGTPLGTEIIGNDDINALYNCADLVFSTGTGGGLGLCALEAMACKVPFMGPDHTIFQEVLADGRGLLVPCLENPAAVLFYVREETVPHPPVDIYRMVETFQRVIAGELELDTMVDKAYRYIKRHKWDNALPLWEKHLEEVLGNSKNPRSVR